MKRFIELQYENGDLVLVNMDLVLHINESKKGKAVLCFDGDYYFTTMQDYEAVKLMLT